MMARNKNKANWDAIQQLVPKNNQFIEQDDPYEFLTMDKGEQIKLLVWCLSLKRNKNINHRFSSYLLKHIYQYSLNGVYITNGQFKGAMAVAGFKVADVEDKNWVFNVNTRDIREEKKRNDLTEERKQEWRRELYRLSQTELLSERERSILEQVKKRLEEVQNG